MKRKSLGSITFGNVSGHLRSACSSSLVRFHVTRNQYLLCGVCTHLVSMPLTLVSCQSRD